jgi:solute carrier family 25 carnitine/acylcarnitine transporter 20/29
MTQSGILAAKDFIAGVGAGLVGIFVGYPIDTIKTRMQIGIEKSVFSALKSSVQRDGFLSLYRGLASPMSGYALMSGLSFGGYGFALRVLQGRQILQESPVLQSMSSGLCSGAFYSLASSPIDRVKIIMQSSTAKAYRSSLACALDITRTYGVRYLYWGYSTNLPREMLGSSMWFGVYHFVKTGVMRFNQVEEPSFAILMLSGAISAPITWFSVFPFDVIRSRIFQEANPMKPKYRNGFDAMAQLYATEGLSWCFRGYSATLLRAIPVGAIIFSLNETFGKVLHGEF